MSLTNPDHHTPWDHQIQWPCSDGQVMHEARELPGLISFCRIAHSQQTGRSATPVLSPGTGIMLAVPLGQGPSLHPFRLRFLCLVHRFPRYYDLVRLPQPSDTAYPHRGSRVALCDITTLRPEADGGLPGSVH